MVRTGIIKELQKERSGNSKWGEYVYTPILFEWKEGENMVNPKTHQVMVDIKAHLDSNRVQRAIESKEEVMLDLSFRVKFKDDGSERKCWTTISGEINNDFIAKNQYSSQTAEPF